MTHSTEALDVRLRAGALAGGGNAPFSLLRDGLIVIDELRPAANSAAELLNRYGQHLGVAESSTGGLVSAALLAVPGASTYFTGGLVVYTQAVRALLIDQDDPAMAGIRPSTEAYALLLATRVREGLGSAWGLGETVAAGPTGTATGMRRDTAASPWSGGRSGSSRWRPGFRPAGQYRDVRPEGAGASGRHPGRLTQVGA